MKHLVPVVQSPASLTNWLAKSFILCFSRQYFFMHTSVIIIKSNVYQTSKISGTLTLIVNEALTLPWKLNVEIGWFTSYLIF